MAGDFAYYELSTVGPYYSSSSNEASTEEKTLCHLLLDVNSEPYPESAELH